MGGKAFPHISEKMIRLPSDQYKEFQTKILEKLQCMDGSNPRAIFSDILSYSSKSTFGDLDLLYTQYQEDCEYPSPKELGQILGAIEWVRNSSVTSYAVPIQDEKFFQVDLIKVGMDEFNFAFGYFAYNDLGNLLGRIYHRAGMKFGHRGLSYVIRDQHNRDYVIKEVLITQNWQEALEFAGYSHKRWLDGFETLEDIFQYAVSCPLASHTIFRLDEMNHTARVRDRKRKTYQQFLLWIDQNHNKIPEKEIISKNELRSQWLEKALNQFPSFKEEYVQAFENHERVKRSHQKFNGQIVQDVTGLTGKELGTFMEDFIHQFIEKICGTTKEEWSLSRSDEEIEILIYYWKTITRD